MPDKTITIPEPKLADANLVVSIRRIEGALTINVIYTPPAGPEGSRPEQYASFVDDEIPPAAKTRINDLIAAIFIETKKRMGF